MNKTNMNNSNINKTDMNKSDWNRILKHYAQPSLGRSSFQLANTILPYLAVYAFGGWWLNIGNLPLWLKALGLAASWILGALLMVRLFILFHDCTHQSYFKSKAANAWWGHLLGMLSFTPFKSWQNEHNIHHGAVGNLDRRGIGDVWTLTVDEFKAVKPSTQRLYRIYRHPVLLFFIAPFVLFLVLHRLRGFNGPKREFISAAITNMGLVAGFVLSGVLFGWKTYFLLQLPILYLAATAGVWLFFVQHQFEQVYWAHHDGWDIVKASLEGSTYLEMPVVLEWFTGWIGYHHIHHLNARIPNYNLKRCYQEIDRLQQPVTVELMSSFKLAFLHLYDEAAGRMIGFRELRATNLLAYQTKEV